MNYKKDFPMLQQKIDGKDFIYLDSAATSQKPQVMIDMQTYFYEKINANYGRGTYWCADKVSKEYEETRALVAQFFGAQQHEIAFTKNATESLNIVAYSWALEHVKQGDEIIVSEVEHHSNLLPWQMVAQKNGAILKIIDVNKDGVITPGMLADAMTSKTKLVSLFHVSNILGSKNDIASLAQIVKKSQAKLCVDGCQNAGYEMIDVKKLGVDFYVWSAHKMLGPSGLGGLYVHESVHGQLQPFMYGGGMVLSGGYQTSEYKMFPYGFEAGTPCIAQVIAYKAAIQYLQKVDFAQLKTELKKMVDYAHQELVKLSDIVIMSAAHSDHIVTFYAKEYHAHDVAAWLDKHAIAVRAGNHCTQPYHDKKRIVASVRLSVYLYNNLSDVEQAIECIKKMYV